MDIFSKTNRLSVAPAIAEVPEILLIGLFFKPPLNIKTKSPQEDEKYVIEYNKPIIEKAITKYLSLKNDLLYIKKVYIHLLEEMEKQMQTVTTSEKI